MKLKINKVKMLGACEIYKTSKIGRLFSRLLSLVSFSFQPSIDGAYMPYSQYQRNIDFYDGFEFQQRTRLTNIENMPSVGCSQ